MQVASCTCDDVHTLWKRCGVPVVLCTCCTYGTGAHVVLCACHTCCVEGMWYYLCASYSHGKCSMCTHCVVLCVGTCIRWYFTSSIDGCTVLYTSYRCMCFMSDVGAHIAWCFVSSVVLCV